MYVKPKKMTDQEIAATGYNPIFDYNDLVDPEIIKEMRRGLEGLSPEEIELREHLARCKALEDIKSEQNIKEA